MIKSMFVRFMAGDIKREKSSPRPKRINGDFSPIRGRIANTGPDGTHLHNNNIGRRVLEKCRLLMYSVRVLAYVCKCVCVYKLRCIKYKYQCTRRTKEPGNRVKLKSISRSKYRIRCRFFCFLYVFFLRMNCPEKKDSSVHINVENTCENRIFRKNNLLESISKYLSKRILYLLNLIIYFPVKYFSNNIRAQKNIFSDAIISKHIHIQTNFLTAVYYSSRELSNETFVQQKTFQ